jgi:two-component system LytT family sensor kinase
MVKVPAKDIELVETYVDLKVKPVDALFLMAIGLTYAGVLVGIVYLAAGEDFLKGLRHGFLLGFGLGGVSYLVVYFNNNYVLPRIERVFLWWIIWCGAAFLIGFFGFLLTYLILHLSKAEIPTFLRQKENFLLSAFVTGILTYLTGLLVYLFVRMRNRKEAVEKLAIEADYKLTLRMVDVHFLINSLNTILELIERDKKLLEDFTNHLVRYLRGVLTTAKIIPIRKELEIVKSYVFAEKVRKGREIVLSIKADEKLLDEPIPSLILQPIVENAIRHGMPEDKDKPFGISIGIKKKGKYILFTVLNNGRPIEEFHPGIGLSLLIKKLEVHEGSLILKSKNPPCFMILLPLNSQKRGMSNESAHS